MKTLLIMRHGQPEDDSPTGDKGRGLTPKGERNAVFIGERAASQFGIPDWVIASDATRTRQTAELAAEAAGFSGDVVLDPSLYDAEAEDLLDVIRHLPQSVERVLLVGHNPGVAMLSMELDGKTAAPPSMPPATLVALQLKIAHWSDVAPQCGRHFAIIGPTDH